MVRAIPSPLTLEAFFNSPLSGDRYELVNGEAILKVAPQRFHSRTQKALLWMLDEWGRERGEVGVEWSVVLKRRGRDWVPIPDLTYVSFDRLSSDRQDDGPCPIPPDLAIEIIAPGQAFGNLAEKASDYLAAGVLRVWIVDPQAQSITVFAPQSVPETYRGDRPIADPLLPELNLTALQVFQRAGLCRL
ncbi:Uma2 family endonuclease [Synechococcus sp. PCC 7336]|uniref:Uma2 family endonuclease n=1 Tax=Synechococcus sp. PCC 7336 TaxID=195250 RepID=UPI000348DDA2|nr:Uma2 family endonuclease [Synechococcus sp. PCC 7336]